MEVDGSDDFPYFWGAEFQVPASSFRGKHDFFVSRPKLGEIGGDPWMLLMDKVWKLFCFITASSLPPRFCWVFFVAFSFRFFLLGMI